MSDRLRRDYRFSTVPEHLIRDKSISDRALRLWCLLDRYAGANGEAFPLRKTLCDDLDCSLASIDRALGDLVTGGWLRKERREAGGSNDYTLLVASGPRVTGEATPRVVTDEDTQSSPVTRPVVTGDAHKEESSKEASEKEETQAAGAAAAEEKRDLNIGRDDVDRVCAHLSQRLTQREVKHTVTKTWRDHARLMMDTDGRSEQQIHNMIEWCNTGWWAPHIHSMPRLREKYDSMREQALRDKQGTATNRHAVTDGAGRQQRLAALGGQR